MPRAKGQLPGSFQHQKPRRWTAYSVSVFYVVYVSKYSSAPRGESAMSCDAMPSQAPPALASVDGDSNHRLPVPARSCWGFLLTSLTKTLFVGLHYYDDDNNNNNIYCYRTTLTCRASTHSLITHSLPPQILNGYSSLNRYRRYCVLHAHEIAFGSSALPCQHGSRAWSLLDFSACHPPERLCFTIAATSHAMLGFAPGN